MNNRHSISIIVRKNGRDVWILSWKNGKNEVYISWKISHAVLEYKKYLEFRR